MSPLPIDIYDQSSKLLSKIKSYYVKETGTSRQSLLSNICFQQ